MELLLKVAVPMVAAVVPAVRVRVAPLPTSVKMPPLIGVTVAVAALVSKFHAPETLIAALLSCNCPASNPPLPRPL